MLEFSLFVSCSFLTSSNGSLTCLCDRNKKLARLRYCENKWSSKRLLSTSVGRLRFTLPHRPSLRHSRLTFVPKRVICARYREEKQNTCTCALAVKRNFGHILLKKSLSLRLQSTREDIEVHVKNFSPFVSHL